MSIPAPFTKEGNVNLFAGQSFTVHFRVSDGAGGYVDLTPRVFAMAAYAADGTELEVVQAAASSSTVILAFDGDMTAAFLPAAKAGTCRLMIAEKVGEDFTPYTDGTLKVQAAPTLTGTDASPSLTGPYLVVEATGPSGTVEVQAFGAPGLSAAEQAFLAGTIDEPTEAALVAYLEQVGEDAVEPFVVQAEAAAEDAGDHEAAAGNFALAAQAFLSGALFLTTGAGVAGVTEGAPFLVQGSTGSATFATLYRKTGGVAVAQGLELASKGSIDAVTARVNFQTGPDPRYVFADGAGNMLFWFDESNFRHTIIDEMAEDVAALGAAGATVAFGGGFPRLIVTDSAGTIILDVTESDMRHVKIDSIAADAAQASGAVAMARRYQTTSRAATVPLTAEVEHLFCDGQSNGTVTYGPMDLAGDPGAWVISSSLGIAASTFPAFATMADAGDLGPASFFNSFAASFTADGNPSIATGGQRFLVSGVAVSGQTIAQLSASATARYGDRITAAKARCDAEGYSYLPLGFTWLQGEANVNDSRSGHLAALRQYQVDRQTQVHLAVGGTRPFPMFTWQLSTHIGNGQPVPNVAYAQLDAALNLDTLNSNIFCIGPEYPYATMFIDPNHLNGLARDLIFAKAAYIAKRWVNDGIRELPLHIRKATQVGDFIILDYALEPGRSLQWTPTDSGTFGYLPVQTNKGFTAYVGGTKQTADMLPKIIGHDRVQLYAPGATRITFAEFTDTAGTSTLPYGNVGLGNLMDDAGDVRTSVLGGTTYRLDNYACHQTIDVTT